MNEEIENITNQIAGIGGTDIQIKQDTCAAYELHLINFTIKGVKMLAQASIGTTEIYAVALDYSTDENYRSNQIEKLGQLAGGVK